MINSPDAYAGRGYPNGAHDALLALVQAVTPRANGVRIPAWDAHATWIATFVGGTPATPEEAAALAPVFAAFDPWAA